MKLRWIASGLTLSLFAFAADLYAGDHQAAPVATAMAPSGEAVVRAAAIPGGNGRITLNVPKGEIRDALRLVAEQGGLNISIGPGVEGEVSVFLTDATLDGALQSIAVDNGFAYKVENGIISVVKPPAAANGEVTPPLETRVFTLRCQDAERVRDALEFALTKFGKMKVLNENSAGAYGTQNLGQLAGELQGSSGSANGSGYYQNQNQNQNNASGPSGVNTTTTTPMNARRIVVTDVAENVSRIAELIGDLDQLPPQVLIEARIVEMSTDLQRQLGVDWNINALANGPVLNHELPLQWEAGFASGSQVRRSSAGVAQSSAGLSLGTIDLSAFTALLQIHEQDNAIRLLANPRLLVFNNHSASILVGERYPILTANITDFGTTTESFDTYIPVGVQLEVTPTIMVDGRITMMVHPATSALGDDVVGTTGLRVARIRTRELSTRVVMGDGQTIVLGGLISDRNTRQVSKVPGLGDLWGFSSIFRQERPRSERVDLLVFLTANVEGNSEISERDQKVYDTYVPHFKQIQKSQDVQLHFEIPSEYDTPKPMYGDPPATDDMDEPGEIEVEETTLSSAEFSQPVNAARVERDFQSKSSTAAPKIAAPAPGPAPAIKRVDAGRSLTPDQNDAAPLEVEPDLAALMKRTSDRNQKGVGTEHTSRDELSARERIIRSRKEAAANRRPENSRRAENTFQGSAVPSRRSRQNSGGRVVRTRGYRVDAQGRPIALGGEGGEN